jgi:hypothetical protein
MRGAIVLVLLAACRYTGAFTCELDEECRARGAIGRCQLDNGFCTFNDATCPSGFRYAESAGDGLANQCSELPMADAGVDSAPGFDPSTCPDEYTGMLEGITTARYILIPVGSNGQGRFVNQIAQCTQAMPGATHAVTVDNATKAAALAAFIDNAQQRVWVGLIQAPDATTVGGGWISFAGDAAPTDLWAPNQPDDANNAEGDHAQQVGAFGSTGLFDMAPTENFAVVCECDGRAISAMAMDYLDRTLD